MSEDQLPLTLQQAARRSGKSEKTLRRWIASGKLVARKVGEKPADPYLVDLKDLKRATGETKEWQIEQVVVDLQLHVEILEAMLEEVQGQLRNQARVIEELKRQRSVPVVKKKATATRQRKTSTTRRMPLDTFKQSNGTKTLQVELWLRVENNNKYVRGKSKARAEIERLVLSQYSMSKKWDDGAEYTLTIPYETDEDLEKTIYDMLQEADSLADLRHCFIETDVRALDGSDRRW
jgi:hypothetical protein